MAVRTIACLPAVTGHWRRAGRRRAALDERELHVQHARRSSAPTSSPPARTINMIRLGEALTTPDAGVGGPPVRALVVYNSQSGRGRARSQRGAARAGARGPVHRGARALPDRHRRLGRHRAARRRRSSSTGTCTSRTATTTSTLNRPAIEPLGEALPNTRDLPAARRAHGARPTRASRDDDLTLIRQALDVARAEAARA